MGLNYGKKSRIDSGAVEDLVRLIELSGNGDLAAYGYIVRRFQDMAYGYAYALLGDFHLAEDATQEAFVQAYRDLATLREPAAFPGWLRRIVFKYCDRERRRRRTPTASLDAAREVATANPDPAESAQTREASAHVLAAIGALPDRERVVTILFHIHGYPQNDIAVFLGVPLNTVKSRLHAARLRLKQEMLTMAKKEMKKRSLPKDFAEKTATLAAILESATGDRLEFQFANGVRIVTRVEKVIGDERGVHVLMCGPTKMECHLYDGTYPDTFDSFVLIPSNLVAVSKLVDTDAVPGSQATEESFEIAGIEKPTHQHPAVYEPAPTATGPLDLTSCDGPGFIRTGGQVEPFVHYNEHGEKKSFPVAPDDIHVPDTMVQDYNLKQGDVITCTWRRGVGNENFPGIVKIINVNGQAPGASRDTRG